MTGQQPAYWTFPCRRSDMLAPVIVFSGLLVAATVICGTIEARSPVGTIDEVQVLNNENVVGPVDVAPAPTNCEAEKQQSTSLASHEPRCSEKRFSKTKTVRRY